MNANQILICSSPVQNSTESEPESESEPQSIFLEGALPHESQILVSDSQTTPEGVYDEEINGSSDEPAVRPIYLFHLLKWIENQSP